MFNPVIFREYDIRGVVGKDFSYDFAYLLARAHARYLQKTTEKTELKISLGHDARLSSPHFYESAIQGYIDSGVFIYKLGLITSPLSYFSTFHIPGLDGAIMITGSHNPPEYNGFKISVGKSTIFGSKIQELRNIIDNKDFSSSCNKGAFEEYDILTPYVQHYEGDFPKMSSLKVVLDCGNGASGVIARKLYEACGLTPHILFENPDGRFPNHHPDPTVEKNMEELKKAVVNQKGNIGIGFDGDADRIGVVDNNGRFVLGDELMIVYAQDILKKKPGAKIIGDVKCSDKLYQIVTDMGGHPIMWKTGHSLIKEKIKSENAPFGGEMSGHIFFNDRNYGYDDALYAGLRLCEILHQSGQSLSEILKDLPRSHHTPEIRIDTTEEKKSTIVMKLIQYFSNRHDLKVNLLDGIRVSYPDGWGLARASNTQPVLVLRFEARTPERLKAIQDEFYRIVEPLL